MKRYSITGRVVTTILIVEFLLVGLTTVLELAYLRAQHLKTFDIMLRGRADSVFGAVQDMEDRADSVFLDTSVLDLPDRDVYEVREESGQLVGRSGNWAGLSGLPPASQEPFRRVEVNGREYRALVLHLTRNIDPTESGPGIAHKIVVFYAAPLRPVWHALDEEAKLLALGNSLLLLVTGVAIYVFLRRGMAPVRALAREAAGISAQSLKFDPPEEACAARELAPLATALKMALERLERAFRQQRTFVGDAAHELKTAVAIVKSSLQLLAFKDRSAEEYRAGLEGCLTDCERLEELVSKMLLLASAEDSSPRLAGAATDLSGCVRGAAEQLDPLARLRGVEVIFHLPAQVETTLPAPECMTLITNLMVNAIQHSPGGSAVVVEVNERGFSVQDYGEGISPESLPFVFDRFYREDGSRARNTGGAGLGLAICKAIVDGHGGRISIVSKPGEGTLVTVELPGLRVKGATAVDAAASRLLK